MSESGKDRAAFGVEHAPELKEVLDVVTKQLLVPEIGSIALYFMSGHQVEDAVLHGLIINKDELGEYRVQTWEVLNCEEADGAQPVYLGRERDCKINGHDGYIRYFIERIGASDEWGVLEEVMNEDDFFWEVVEQTRIKDVIDKEDLKQLRRKSEQELSAEELQQIKDEVDEYLRTTQADPNELARAISLPHLARSIKSVLRGKHS